MAAAATTKTDTTPLESQTHASANHKTMKILREATRGVARLHTKQRFADLGDFYGRVRQYLCNRPSLISDIDGLTILISPNYMCHLCNSDSHYPSLGTRAVSVCFRCRKPICDRCSRTNIKQCPPADLVELRRTFKRGLNTCEACGRAAKIRCKWCSFIAYCSAKCQHEDWVRHKTQCKEDFRTYESLQVVEYKMGSAQCFVCGNVFTPTPQMAMCTHAAADARWERQWREHSAIATTTTTTVVTAATAATTTVATHPLETTNIRLQIDDK